MNDISERDGKFYVVDTAGKPISEGYATQAEAEGVGKPVAMTGAPIQVGRDLLLRAIEREPASDLPVPAVTEAKPPKQRTTYLSEAAVMESAADGAIAVTLIKPGWSANGRYYSRESLARAVKQFEGTKAYLDHPSRDDEKNRPERSVKDIAGYYSDVRQADDGRLTASLRLIGANGDFVRPLVAEALAGKSDLIGLSINALGKTTMGEAEGKKGIIVEDIVKGNSTDIVTTPAAGGRFESLRASDDGFTADLLAAMDYDEWAGARPDFTQRLRESMKALRQDEAIKEAQTQAAAQREANAALEARNKVLEAEVQNAGKLLADMRAAQALRASEGWADKLLSESRLPTGWQIATRKQLLTESNTGLWPAVVAGEREKFLSVKPHIPTTIAGAVTYAGAIRPVAESIVPGLDETPEAYGKRRGYL